MTSRYTTCTGFYLAGWLAHEYKKERAGRGYSSSDVLTVPFIFKHPIACRDFIDTRGICPLLPKNATTAKTKKTLLLSWLLKLGKVLIMNKGLRD
jgi:hypothetical protein